MKVVTIRHLAFTAAVIAAAPLSAQSVTGVGQANATPSSSVGTAGRAAQAAETTSTALYPLIQIQHLRPRDQRGINVFEAPAFHTRAPGGDVSR